MGTGITLGGGFFIPLARFTDILWDTLSFVVKDAEIVLGIGMALGGSLFQPFVRFAVILRYSFPFVVEDGKVALCGGIAPDSRFSSHCRALS